jgi:hypothetical protein
MAGAVLLEGGKCTKLYTLTVTGDKKMFAKVQRERGNADAGASPGFGSSLWVICRFWAVGREFRALLPFCRMRVILDGVTRYD